MVASPAPMQGAFEFYGELPRRPALPERLFFGLFPDPETSLRVRRFAEGFASEHRLPGKLLKPERLHLSLQQVGDYRRLRSKFVYAARRAAETVAARPFAVTLRFIGTFDDSADRSRGARLRPLTLQAEDDALFDLSRRLGEGMTMNGLRAEELVMPHMTLLYGPKRTPRQAVEPIRFRVRDFALVHSELGLTRYNIIGRWPLAS